MKVFCKECEFFKTGFDYKDTGGKTKHEEEEHCKPMIDTYYEPRVTSEKKFKPSELNADNDCANYRKRGT